ncbi:hypothetical protein CIT26_15890 [Mesorhizobium temperatum]|uniref:Uncharacterized protein n=1 Tax=Mesorhizobium temperatum TaxID=241416 RepID=A0A271LJW6_9HYPH|nr:hypothetical protein CIT26_15890 [Mesorhizobium temperatum]
MLRDRIVPSDQPASFPSGGAGVVVLGTETIKARRTCSPCVLAPSEGVFSLDRIGQRRSEFTMMMQPPPCLRV